MSENDVARTNGRNSSEYAEARKADLWTAIGIGLSAVIAIAGQVIPLFQEGGELETQAVAAVLSAVIATLSIVQSVLVRLGYIKARTALKTGLAKSAAKAARKAVAQ